MLTFKSFCPPFRILFGDDYIYDLGLMPLKTSKKPENYVCDLSNFCNVSSDGLVVTILTIIIAMKAKMKPGSSS